MEEMATLFSDDFLDDQETSKVKVAFSDRAEFRTVDDATTLFDGFKTMKVITWSYGLGMVIRQMRKFEHVELVFGCSAMLEREVKLSSIAPLVQQGEIVRHLQSKAGREISDRVAEGTCELYFESTVKSHQKLYLLADEEAGCYRVIAGSPNLSSTAWSGDKQKEVWNCYEGKECYESFLFELYEPFKRTCATHVADLKAVLDRVDETGFPTLEDLPMLRPANGIVVIEQCDDAEGHISMADCALYGGLDGDRVEALESAIKLVGGRALLDRGSVEELKLRGREIEQSRAEEIAMCPKLVVDERGSVALNGKAVTPEGFAEDAGKLVEFIDSFEIFSGDVEGYKSDAWKIACWYFATPFFPRLRRACRSARQDGRVSSLPMHLILFGTSNAGKTELMRFLGKAMCGEDVRPLPGNAYKAGRAVKKVNDATIRKPRLMQINQQGLPVLYDDVPSSELSESKLRMLLIDSLEEQYDEEFDRYPAIVATSNITPSMPREFRKRALFFESGASLPLAEAIRNGHIPTTLTEDVGAGMFAEYAARMAPLIAEMCCVEGIDSLDVYRASSRSLAGILEDAGCRPIWAVELSNDDYFGEKAESRRAVQALDGYFRAHPDCFDRNARENSLLVHYSTTDRSAAKLINEVSTSLPPRCDAKLITGMLTLNLRETEDVCGRRFKVRKGLLEMLGL